MMKSKDIPKWMVGILLMILAIVAGGATVGSKLDAHADLPGHPLGEQRMEYMQEDIREIKQMVEVIYGRED